MRQKVGFSSTVIGVSPRRLLGQCIPTIIYRRKVFGNTKIDESRISVKKIPDRPPGSAEICLKPLDKSLRGNHAAGASASVTFAVFAARAVPGVRT
jgi:hypothetical protein